MQINLDCKEILALLKTVKPVTLSRCHMPILEYFHIKVTGCSIVFNFTDLETWVSVNVAGQCDEPGDGLIHAAKLTKILTGKKGRFTISGTDSNLELTFDNGLVIGRGKDDPFLNVDDYPLPIDLSETITNRESVNTTDFVTALARCKYAMSVDDSRYNLNYVCLKDNDCVATDGHRLEKTSLNINDGVLILLPRKSVQLITQKGLWGKSSSLTIIHSPKFLTVCDARYSIMATKIEGDYPDYSRVIPSIYPSKVMEFNRAALLSAAKEFKPFMDDRKHAVKVVLNGKIELSFEGTKLSVPGQVEKLIFDEEITFLINGFYFADAVKAGKSDTLKMNYYKEGAPIILESEDHQYSLVMPMRI
jgi:DNA polymerase-3 subunit beta